MPEIDKVLRDIIGPDVWAEYFMYMWELTGLTGGTGVSFTDSTVKVDTDAPFAVQSRTFVATSADAYIQMIDQGKGRIFFDRKKNLRTIAGQPVAGSSVGLTGAESLFSPLPLLAPYIIDPGAAVTLSVADNSGSTNAVRFTLHGGKLRRGKAPWDKPLSDRYEFDYGDEITVPASGVAVLVIPIQQDADFVVRAITGLRASGSMYITIRDGSTQRAWQNTRNYIDNVVGNAAAPNVLTSPRFIERGTNIEVELFDQSGSSNLTRLVFHGEKIIE